MQHPHVGVNDSSGDNGGFYKNGNSQVATSPNLNTDPRNCGMRGHVCRIPPNGVAICENGQCSFDCNEGFSACSGICVTDLSYQSDINNCGMCGNACSSGQLCRGGVCELVACPSGETACFGECTNLNMDNNNCGSCHNICPTGHVCMSRNCEPCQSGHAACGGQCLDIQSDNNNCGSCGTQCRSTSTVANLCSEGTCTRAGRCINIASHGQTLMCCPPNETLYEGGYGHPAHCQAPNGESHPLVAPAPVG